MQPLQSIEPTQTVTLSNFVIMVKIKNRLFNKFQGKRVLQHDDCLIFNSVANTTKYGETKIYKAVQELKPLVKTNNGKDRSVDGKQYPEHT